MEKCQAGANWAHFYKIEGFNNRNYWKMSKMSSWSPILKKKFFSRNQSQVLTLQNDLKNLNFAFFVISALHHFNVTKYLSLVTFRHKTSLFYIPNQSNKHHLSVLVCFLGLNCNLTQVSKRSWNSIDVISLLFISRFR